MKERVEALGAAMQIIQDVVGQVTSMKGLAILDAIICNYQEELHNLQQEWQMSPHIPIEKMPFTKFSTRIIQ